MPTKCLYKINTQTSYLERFLQMRRSEDNINIVMYPPPDLNRRLSQKEDQKRLLVFKVANLGLNVHYVKSVAETVQQDLQDLPFEEQVSRLYDYCLKTHFNAKSQMEQREPWKRPLSRSDFSDEEESVTDEHNPIDGAMYPLQLRWFHPLQNPIEPLENDSIQIVQKVEQSDKDQDLEGGRPKPLVISWKGPHFRILERRQEMPPEEPKSESNIIRNQSEEPEKRDCQICFDSIPEFDMKTVAPCHHQFCNDCILSYMEDCIKTANVLRVNCPMEGCTEEYTEAIIESNVSGPMFQKFKKFKFRRIISQDPNVRWCPKPNCELYVVGGTFSKKLVCACGQEICFDCGNPFHPEQSCEGALDEFYVKAKKQYLIYPCPKCKAPIQKNSGCNHMTCYQCHHQFCWLCMGNYSKIHYTIWNFCGCIVPGGQFYQSGPWSNAMFWRTMMFLPKLIGVILLITVLCALLPISWCYNALRLPYICYKKCCSGKYYLRRLNSCKRIFVYFGFFLLGVVLFPISLPIVVLPITIYIIYREIRYRL